MKIRDMVYVGLFAAVTAQTLGVMLAGSILGAKKGGLSLLVFLALVAVGAPVLSGGRGGFPVLIGPSGGYILSWPIAAFVIGWLVERFRTRLNAWKVLMFNIIGGIVLVYFCGSLYLSIVTEMSLGKAAATNIAFIPGDLIKAIVASLIAVKMKQVRPVIKKEIPHEA